ncbi:MAG: alpha/beta fold hydrolase [Thermoguttaceae bacterium]|jgi:pimeloyl-ACP methyl ester carboxylesterase
MQNVQDKVVPGPAGGIDWAVWDAGRGPPLLLVHGFPLDRSMWAGQVAGLARGRRVIAPDLRGFGRSGVTPGIVTVGWHADDLAFMLDALNVTEPIVLAGLSMGGYIALQFYQRHRARLRGLVLCDSRAGADTPQTAAGRRQLADRAEREGPQVWAEMMLPRLLAPATLRHRPELLDRVRQMIVGSDPRGQAATARGLALRPDFTPLLPRIDCPTLLVVGREDTISTPAETRAMAGAIPAAQLAEIDDAGHLSPLEQPAEVNRAIEEFLKRV